MSTEAERDERRGWADEVRVAATWVSGRHARKLENLADRIDPDKESPESPEEEAARQTAEREAAAEAAAAQEAEAAKVAEKAEKVK